MPKSKIIEQRKNRLEKAKNALAEGNAEQSIDELLNLQEADIATYLQTLSGRLQKLQQEDQKGVLTYSEKNISFNKILVSLSEIIELLENRFDENRKALQRINNFLKSHYEEILSQKLAGRETIPFRYMISGEGTTKEGQELYVSTIDIEKLSQNITETFEAAAGRLLITGQPGAGKSTLLLELALGLLAKVQRRIPIILTLKTWRPEYGTIEKWLDTIEWSEFFESKKITKEVFETGSLILLLDALDEVNETDRASCLEAIAQYRVNSQNQFVICSRTSEYSEIEYDAPVDLQVEVLSFTPEQLEKELHAIGRTQSEAIPLLKAIEKDPFLSKALETPFFFNIAQLLFARGKKWSDWKFTEDSEKGRKKELLDRFLDIGINKPKEKDYPFEKTIRWLAFLSHKMRKDRLADFELINLQPNWWTGNKMHILLFGLIIGVISGLGAGAFFGWNIKIILALSQIGGFSFGLFSWLVARIFRVTPSSYIQNIYQGLRFALIAALVYALIGAITPILTTVSEVVSICGVIFFLGTPIFGLSFMAYKGFLAYIAGNRKREIIITNQRLYWNWQNFKRNWRKELPANFRNGAILGALLTSILGIFVSFGYLLEPINNGYYQNQLETVADLTVKDLIIAELIGTFFFAITFALFGIFIGTILGILNGIFISGRLKGYYLSSKTPYRRLFISLSHFSTLFLEHFTFRFLIYLDGNFPLHLVAFLEEMAKRNILISQGGRWAFRHNLIQEYFLNTEIPKKEKND